ncbi:MAG: hypothetical protein MJ240_08975 [Kiritimatiellae bacterium]|nr:hypothetical protein [Kiritimatiellia bacterium]
MDSLDKQSLDERLIEACGELDLERVRDLIDAGASLSATDGEETPVTAVLRCDGYWQRLWALDERELGEDGGVPPEICEEREQQMVVRQLQCLELLIDRGADVNEVPDGSWPVGFRSVSCDPKVVRFLLEHGMDPNLTTEWFGNSPTTALEYAWGEEVCCEGCDDLMDELRRVVCLLLEYGALPQRWEDIEELSMSLEEMRSFDSVPQCVMPSMPDGVADLSAADRELLAASRRHSLLGVSQALRKGANPNARDPNDSLTTPMMAALRCAYYEMLGNPSESDYEAWRKDTRSIVMLLLENGADPNLGEVNEEPGRGPNGLIVEGVTPLHHAAWLDKDVEISQILLDHGANPNVIASESELSTVRDMNDQDYNVDDPLEVKPIECLMNRYGGCCYYVFDPDCEKELSDVNQALVYGCQRMDYSVVMRAIQKGADRSLREWGRRCLPVIVMNDAPQLRGKYYFQNGLDVEDEVVNFILFLLGGISVPIGDREIDDMIYACIDNGMEKVLAALVAHHKYGTRFVERSRMMPVGGWPWECWPKDKQVRMAAILTGNGPCG